MTQNNTLNVNLYNPQLNKLNSRIKIGTEVNLNPSSNVIGESDDEINFPHKLLNYKQVLKLCRNQEYIRNLRIQDASLGLGRANNINNFQHRNGGFHENS